MRGSNIRPQSFAFLLAVGLSAILVSCSGGGSSTLNGSGGAVAIQVSATDATALVSAVESRSGDLAMSGSGGSGDSGGATRPQLQSFEVTFSSIAALDAERAEVPVTIALPVTVDLLTLTAGRTVELPVGFLPAGTYRGFVVTLSTASLVLQDGTRVTIEPPGAGWTTRIPTAPFEVVEGQPTTVELRLRLGQALRWLRDHFEFHPDFECHVGGHDSGH